MASVFSSTPGSASRGVVSVAGLVVIALVLPVFGVRAWSVGYADRLASRVAAGLRAVVPAQSADESAYASADESALPDGETLLGDASSSVRATALDAKRPRVPVPARAVQRGVRISAAQVLALASRRAMPQAVPVKANAQHPAGLLLRGVGALGIGMQDGDVLTEAAGQKATSVGTVVGIVLAARGRQVPEISGRFYRAGVPYSLTVEQPYPKQPVPG